MNRKRYTEEQIIRVVKEAESGVPVSELVRTYGISEGTFYRWKSKFGGMDRRLRELEDENRRLKRIVAEQQLDIVMLKDINSKNW
jgi:putative transposase